MAIKYKSRIPTWAWLCFTGLAFVSGIYQLSVTNNPTYSQSSVIQQTNTKQVSKFKVLESKQYYLRVVNEEGQIELRTGGSITWRTNNPAKIMWGDWAKSQGAHEPGKDQTVAIFPSEEIGRKANYTLLFLSKAYAHLTLENAIKKYAPSSEGYNTQKYLNFIKNKTKIDPNKVMKSLTETERNQILNAIKEYEEWIPGKVTVFNSEQDWKERGW